MKPTSKDHDKIPVEKNSDGTGEYQLLSKSLEISNDIPRPLEHNGKEIPTYISTDIFSGTDSFQGEDYVLITSGKYEGKKGIIKGRKHQDGRYRVSMGRRATPCIVQGAALRKIERYDSNEKNNSKNNYCNTFCKL